MGDLDSHLTLQTTIPPFRPEVFRFSEIFNLGSLFYFSWPNLCVLADRFAFKLEAALLPRQMRFMSYHSVRYLSSITLPA